jgi:hypothetical protein
MSKSSPPKFTQWLLPTLVTLILGASLYLVRSGPPTREDPTGHQQPPPSSRARPVPASGDNHHEARATSPPQAADLTQVAPPAPAPAAPASAPAAAAAPATVTATAGD